MSTCKATLLATILLATACTGARGDDPIRIGAIYPLTGPQRSGGIDEYRGVQLAADLVNADGGVNGRPIELVPIDVTGPDGAPGAIERLADDGVDLVLGTDASTISEVATPAASARGLLYWETGAVGMLPAGAGLGTTTFRVPPTGGTLGRAAIAFVADRLLERLGRDPSSLRYAVSFVDDAYGRAVAEGALQELRARGLQVVGDFGYDFRTLDADALARRIAASDTDVLFVSAYLDDGIALREALVRHHVGLVANIGTSSSYCMPEFGDVLGRDAVGLFASDKPAASPLNLNGLSPDARSLLERANSVYRERWNEDLSPPANAVYPEGWNEDLSAPALAGFSAAWAFFADVLPRAAAMTPEAVAAAARSMDLPMGSLPNGSGLRFGPAGTAEAGENLAAASVIWEWVSPGDSQVVWPPAFATHPIEPLPLTP